MPRRSADKQSGSGVKTFFAAIAISLACSSVTIAVYDRFFAQKIVAIDLTACIASQKEDYIAGRITAGELVENIEGLLGKMRKKAKNEVLVLEEAVSGDVKHYDLGPHGTAPDEEEKNRQP